MKKFIINIHSFIDVITNSSTEIFIIETDIILDFIKDLIEEQQTLFPNEYGHNLYVSEVESWDLDNITEYIDTDDAIKRLTMLGYKITPPAEHVNKPMYLKIYAERGGMHPRMEQFIRETFNVIDYTSEG